MDIKNTTSPIPLSPTTKLQIAGLPTWQIGQVLTAKVLSTNLPNISLLSIGDNVLRAKTDKSLTEGQTLKVEVIKPAAPITLRVISDSEPQQGIRISELWKQILPKQLPLSVTFTYLSQLVQNDKVMNSLPPALSSALQQLTTNLPTIKDVSSPESLQNSLLSSGIFLESKLADALLSKRAYTGWDIKSELLKIAQLLGATNIDVTNARPDLEVALNSQLAKALDLLGDKKTAEKLKQPASSPAESKSESGMDFFFDAELISTLKELAGKIENSLSRIATHQLNMSMPNSEAPYLILELPVQNKASIDIVNIKILKENNKTDTSTQTWRISIAIDLPSLGPLLAKISMTKNTCGVCFLAEKNESVEAINLFLPLLADNLKNNGLMVNNLMCIQGKLNSDDAPSPETLQSIIDLHV